MATVRDVAREAGVSLATVSRVLNNRDVVRPETRERVIKAVEKLDYVPSATARSLKTSCAKTIGLILPSLTNPFFPSLIDAASREAETSGYSVLIKVDNNPVRAAHFLARSNAVDGIVIVDNQWVSSDMQEEPLTVPAVAFDRVPNFPVAATYQVSNFVGAGAVTSHLIDIGCRTLLHISGPEGFDVTSKRLSGFREAVLEEGKSKQISVHVGVGDFSFDSGRRVAHEYLSQHPEIDGIFAANDLMAIGAINAAKDLGKECPREVAIAGFDGIDIGRYTTPRLTTYEQPIDVIARDSVQHLLRILQDGDRPGECTENAIRTYSGSLKVLESTERFHAMSPDKNEQSGHFDDGELK